MLYGNMAAREMKRPKLRERCCPHCNEIVSYKTYKAHKRIHYCYQSNTWFDGYQATTQQISFSSDSEPDESFSCESSPRSSPERDNDFSMCLTDIDDSESFPPLSDPGLSDSDSHSHDEEIDESKYSGSLSVSSEVSVRNIHISCSF